MKDRVLLLSYAACGTCKRALAWLKARGIDADVRAIVEAPPTLGELEEWVARSGLPLHKWLNTSGQSYRALGKDAIAAMSDRELRERLANDGKLVKRPVLVTRGAVLVGFREEDYEELFGQ